MKYDLGQKQPNGPCCMGDDDEDEEKVYYPTLYFTGDTKMDIPDEGTAVITFRKVDSGENTRDPEDPKYRCEIEVQSIEVKGVKKKDAPLTTSLGDVMKGALAKAKAASAEEED